MLRRAREGEGSWFRTAPAMACAMDPRPVAEDEELFAANPAAEVGRYSAASRLALARVSLLSLAADARVLARRPSSSLRKRPV